MGIEDFAKVEMRVGQIKTAERIVGADKLLKLTVDIGTEIRQICAGIAQFYEPEKLIGRKVAVVVNLAPRKLRGVESNGMIIAASVGPEGRPVLAGFPDEAVEIGARLQQAFLCRGAACSALLGKISTMGLIDSHAPLDFPQFAEDRDPMLYRARAAG